MSEFDFSRIDIAAEITTFLIYCLSTLLIYQGFAYLQRATKQIWLNPMLLTMFVVIPLLLANNIAFEHYYQYSKIYSFLLEPAIVALGFPLYQQIQTIRAQFNKVMLVLVSSISLMLAVNVVMAVYIFNQHDIAVSLALKSITTPIALALTEQMRGIAAITAVAIIIAGLVGAIWGIRILNFLGIKSKRAQGLAIGCASHALGTSNISQISYQHGAFSSLALILSAIITAIFSPIIIPMILSLMA